MSDASSKAALNRICNLVPELNMKHTDTLISLLKTYRGEPEEAEIEIGEVDERYEQRDLTAEEVELLNLPLDSLKADEMTYHEYHEGELSDQWKEDHGADV